MRDPEEPTPQPVQPEHKRPPAVVVVLIVAALFVGLLVVKNLSAPSDTSSASGTVQPAAELSAEPSAEPPAESGPSISTTRNDAIADYEAALEAGKPIYLLFHSLSCDPCIEISAVVDDVLPDYEGSVTFVNAITDDESARQLASSFGFQYIPTSFFIAPDGTIVEQYTGTLTADDMRSKLDALVAQ